MACIAVIAALAPELRAFGKAGEPRSAHGGSYMTVVCGTGGERAYEAGKRLVRGGATALVSWGTAAALVATLRPGALVLPVKVIARDGDVLHVDAEWHRRVRARVARRVHTGAIAETDAPLLRADAKRALATRTGADAADMESAALASVAREAGIPLLVVRAIVDGSAVDVPSRFATAVRCDGTMRVAATLASLAASPRQWPAALRLARGFGAALTSLRRVALAVHAES